MSLRRDLAWTGGAQALVAVLQLLLQMALARLLPPSEFGAFAAAYAVYAIAEALLLNRGAELAQREIGRLWVTGAYGAARSEAQRITRRDLRAITVGAVLLAAASPLLARAFDFDPLPLALLAIGLPLQSGYGVSKAVMISAARFDVQARLEFGFIATQCVLGIAGAVIAGAPGYAIGLVFASAGKTVLAARQSRALWPAADDTVTSIITSSSAAARLETQTTVRTALLLLAQQADLLLIGSILGRDSVALYRAAKSLSSIPGRAAAPIWSVIRPRLLRAWHAQNHAEVRRLVRQPAALFVVAAAVFVPFLPYVAASGLTLLYGAGYEAARTELLLLFAGTWFSTAISGWFAYWTVIAGRLMLATSIAALQLGLIAAGALLAPTYGTAAVAAAASAAMGFTALLGWAALYRATSAARTA